MSILDWIIAAIIFGGLSGGLCEVIRHWRKPSLKVSPFDLPAMREMPERMALPHGKKLRFRELKITEYSEGQRSEEIR